MAVRAMNLLSSGPSTELVVLVSGIMSSYNSAPHAEFGREASREAGSRGCSKRGLQRTVYRAVPEDAMLMHTIILYML